MFNIKKTKEYLFELCKEDKEIDRDFLENKMVTFWDRHGISIYLDSNGFKLLKKAIEEVRKDELIKFNFLGKYIEDKIKDIISNCSKLSLDERSDFIEDQLNILRSELKKDIKEWVFWIPIVNFQLMNNSPLNVGNVKFFTLDQTKGTEITDKIKISDENDKSFKKHIEEIYITPKLDNVFAEVKVRGVREYARENAMNQIRMAINVLRIYSPSNQVNFGIEGEITPKFYRKTFEFTADYEKKVFPLELMGSIHEFWLNENRILFMKNNGFDRLDQMLKSRNPSFFETRILTAIYWFGEAVGTEIFEKKIYEKRNKPHENLEYFKNGEKYLKLSTALESILTFEQYEPIQLNISERAALLIGTNYNQRKNIKSVLKDLYTVRSRITHDGSVFVSKHDIEDLTYVFRNILFVLLELDNKYKFKTKKDISDYFERLKLSCTSSWQ